MSSERKRPETPLASKRNFWTSEGQTGEGRSGSENTRKVVVKGTQE
jgi:hypothetical protein